LKSNIFAAQLPHIYERGGTNMENEITLVIWFKNGVPAFFEQVENFGINGGETIEFNYYGKSTQTKKHAEFIIDNIAGYAWGK
jgi:hypothetical protein